jgi:hypothetical protein
MSHQPRSIQCIQKLWGGMVRVERQRVVKQHAGYESANGKEASVRRTKLTALRKVQVSIESVEKRKDSIDQHIIFPCPYSDCTSHYKHH